MTLAAFSFLRNAFFCILWCQVASSLDSTTHFFRYEKHFCKILFVLFQKQNSKHFFSFLSQLGKDMEMLLFMRSPLGEEEEGSCFSVGGGNALVAMVEARIAFGWRCALHFTLHGLLSTALHGNCLFETGTASSSCAYVAGGVQYVLVRGTLCTFKW